THNHHHEEKTSSAAGMKRREFLRVCDVQFLTRLEIVNSLVFGAVILEYAIHVSHQRDAVQEDYKNQNPEESVDGVEQKRALKPDLRLKQPRDAERKCNKNQKVDADCQDEVSGNQPRRHLGRIGLALLLRRFFSERLLGRKLQSANAQNQSLAQDAHAADDGR